MVKKQLKTQGEDFSSPIIIQGGSGMDIYNMNLFLTNLTNSLDKPQIVTPQEEDMRSLIELVVEYPYVTGEMVERIDLDTIDEVLELLEHFNADEPSMPSHPIIEMILSQSCKNNLLNLKPSKTTLSVNLF